MSISVEAIVFWSVILIQLVGFASIALARLSEHCFAQVCLQRLCYVGFFAVGVALISAVALGWDCWLAFGITLAMMAVGATLDFRHSSRLAEN